MRSYVIVWRRIIYNYKKLPGHLFAELLNLHRL